MWRSPAERSYGTESVAAAATSRSPGFSPSHFRRTLPPERDARRRGRAAVARRERPERRSRSRSSRRSGRGAGARSGARVGVREVARAEPEVQDGRAQAGREPEREEPLRVDGVRAALEAVEDEERRRAVRHGGVGVVQVERVAVGRRERLAARAARAVFGRASRPQTSARCAPRSHQAGEKPVRFSPSIPSCLSSRRAGRSSRRTPSARRGDSIVGPHERRRLRRPALPDRAATPPPASPAPRPSFTTGRRAPSSGRRTTAETSPSGRSSRARPRTGGSRWSTST